MVQDSEPMGSSAFRKKGSGSPTFEFFWVRRGRFFIHWASNALVSQWERVTVSPLFNVRSQFGPFGRWSPDSDLFLTKTYKTRIGFRGGCLTAPRV